MPSFERGRRVPRPGALAVLASVSAIVLLTIGCGPGASPGANLDQLRGDRKLNVLLVTLDTTRADHIGVYGFDQVDTPVIDGLAARGVTFMRAYASTPLTLPSHTSLFTGTHPPYHGVRDNGVHVAPEGLQTLAESFQQAGYRTGAFVGAFVLDSRWGLAQGFDRYFDDFELPKQQEIFLGRVQRPGSEVIDTALAWAGEDDTTPFFMWVHLYDPHTPYDPPEPFRSRYANPYVGEIAWTDSLVGRLTSWLDDSGRSDDTYVAVTADHGESLGEHGENEHGLLLYESAIRVPLIIATPFDEPRGIQRHEPVSLIDVMPTMLELTGLQTPEVVHGRSLVPLFTQDTEVEGWPDEPVYAETFYTIFCGTRRSSRTSHQNAPPRQSRCAGRPRSWWRGSRRTPTRRTPPRSTRKLCGGSQHSGTSAATAPTRTTRTSSAPTRGTRSRSTTTCCVPAV
jgi:hypothetical protein